MNTLPYNIDILQHLCYNGKIIWKEHALQRLLQRNILRAEIKQSIMNGEIIEIYDNDKPFPSCLILGYTQNTRPLHIVCSTDGNYLYIITAYEPNNIKFCDDLKTRRN